MNTKKHALSSIGAIQAIESGLRCSVSIIFRLLIGYLAGLPAIALSVNAVISMGLGLALELPAGVIADNFGTVICVRLGYLLQAFASILLLVAILLWPYYPIVMWTGIILEGIFDAFGNALLSGAREVVYKKIITRACHDDNLEETVRLEREFLVLSESYGRFFLLAFPSVLLSLTVALNYFWKIGHLTLIPISFSWIYLAVKTQRLAKQFEVTDSIITSGSFSLLMFLRNTGNALRLLPHEAKSAAAIFITFSFLFSTVHGYLVISLLHQDLPWLKENLWYSVVIVNLAFIGGRLMRSYVLPWLMKKIGNSKVVLLGSMLVFALGIAFFLLFKYSPTPIFYCILLIFPIAFDNAIGFTSRPSFGILVSAAPKEVAASVLSAISAAPPFLGALLALWLTSTGKGYPSVGEIIIILATGSTIGIYFSRKICR